MCAADKLRKWWKSHVEAHKDGFGFAVPLTPTGQGDFVLYQRQCARLMHGDIVTVRPAGIDRRGRREGQVLDISLSGRKKKWSATFISNAASPFWSRKTEHA